MKPTVYIETTIPSYLTAWPSRDLVRAGEQQMTRDWWARRSEYELRVSSLVILECSDGDQEAAAQRLAAIEGVYILAETQEADALAATLVQAVPLPPRAAADALHIAMAAVNGISYPL
ncbi:type II toxin-antitoxin system VapC family toxin, partial [Aquisphaera insulae]|uniref:type II toxin-antitoxin system VapC family toxin n=1 Tax=Aquisphaera insulae TaxID=2712864 RepID=UPI0013EC457C